MGRPLSKAPSRLAQLFNGSLNRALHCGRKRLPLDLIWPRSIVVGALIAALTSGAIQAAGQLPYGSRAGEEVTITEMDGIDSAKAVIKIRHTRDNARGYCVDYLGHEGDQCIDQVLKDTQVSDSIKGDCRTGQFVNLAGRYLIFAGPNFDHDAVRSAPEYRIFSKGAKTFLNGTMASGYDVNLSQFRALCPSKFAAAELAFAARPKYVGRWYIDDQKVCREDEGQAEGLLVYKAREFVGMETNCSFKSVQANGSHYDLSMDCNSEGEIARGRREILEVNQQNKLERTVIDGKKPVKFSYNRC